MGLLPSLRARNFLDAVNRMSEDEDVTGKLKYKKGKENKG